MHKVTKQLRFMFENLRRCHTCDSMTRESQSLAWYIIGLRDAQYPGYDYERLQNARRRIKYSVVK